MKTNKFKKPIIISLITVLVLVIIYVGLKKIGDINLEKQGNSIIQKIELYESKNGNLPNSLRDVGILESSPWLYEKIDDKNYIIYYPLGFDESKNYYSETKEWKDLP